MKTASSSPALRRRSTPSVHRLPRAAALAFILSAALYAIVLILSILPGARDDLRWIRTLALPCIQFLVSAAAALAASRARPPALRRSWLCFLLASLLGLLAMGLRVAPLWLWLVEHVPLPAFLPDALQALSYPAYLAGLLRYPTTPATPLMIWKQSLGTIASILSAAIVLAHLSLVSAMLHPSPLILWLYPLADAVLMIQLFSILTRLREEETWPATFALGLSLVSWLVSDLARANFSHLDQFAFTWEITRLLGQWGIIWAALHSTFRDATPSVSKQTRHSIARVISGVGALTEIGLSVAVLLVGIQHYISSPAGPVKTWFLAGFVAIILMLGTRHTLELRMIEELLDSLRTINNELEERVRDRTQKLRQRVGQNQRLRAEAERRVLGMAALQRATRESLQPLPLEERAQAILDVLIEALACDGCWLGFLNPETGRLGPVASAGTILGSKAGSIDSHFSLDPGSHSPVMIALATAEPVLIQDPVNAPIISSSARELAQKHSVSSIVCVPIIIDGQPMGVITVSRRKPHARFDQVDLDLVTAFARQTAMATAEAHLYEEIQQRAQEQTTLLQTAEAVTSSLDLEEVLATLAREAARLLQAEAAAIYYYDDNRAELELHARFPSLPTKEPTQPWPRFPLAQSDAAEEAVHTKRPVLIADAAQDPRRPILLGDVGITSSLLLPLLVQGLVQGLLILDRFQQGHPFNEQHLKLGAALTQHTNIAVLNAQLYEELQARMQELRLSQTTAVRSQRLQGLRHMVAGAAHEMNNPLTVVRGYAELLAGQDLPQQARDDAQRILHAAERCQFVVKNLLTFGGHIAREQGPTDVNDLLERSLALCQSDLTTANIAVERQLAEDLHPVNGDESLLQQVFFNIITNTTQAITETHTGGIITVRSTQKLAGQTPLVRIEIHNDGPEIPADIIEHVFDPFFTTRRPERGSGLGLSVCFGIIKEHGGKIWAQSPALLQPPEAAGPGATFIVELPAMDVKET